MNARSTLCLAALLLMMPLAYAHDPAGTPKNYCELESEWDTHDWNSDPPSTRFSTKGLGSESSTDSHPGGDRKAQWPYTDGNQADCDGITNVGTPCAGFGDPEDPLPFFAGLCAYNPPVADSDGHKEFGVLAHALILAGPESLDCWHEAPHHAPFGSVTVWDIVLGAGASFSVNADTFSLLGNRCGDFQFDQSMDCTGSCSVIFAPGLDGAYHVVVQGTQGHVFW